MRLIWGTVFITIVVGLGLPLWDVFHNTTPDSHPLQTDRLVFRIIGFCFVALIFAMVWRIAYLANRPLARLRKGLCPACGYDLRVHLESKADSETHAPAPSDRCPECGEAVVKAEHFPAASSE